MTNLEQAIVLMRDLWTLLSKADDMMAEAMDALEMEAASQDAMVALPTLLVGARPVLSDSDPASTTPSTPSGEAGSTACP